MTDLVSVQKRLNEDKALRERFLLDPVETLKDLEIDLTPQMAKSVDYLVDQVKRPGHLVPGAGIAPKDLAAITITIGVDF